MIKELRLKNFKQHRDATFSFSAGLNTIQGGNAVGKSNILKAILFALQGASAAGNKSRLTTRGATGMKVELDCSFPGAGNVTVVRALNNAQVTSGGAVLAAGHSAVTSWVETQLGMGAQQFKSMLYAEQNKTQKLLDEGPTALQKQLEIIANTGLIDGVLAFILRDNDHDAGELQGLGEVGDLEAMRGNLAALLETQRAQTIDRDAMVDHLAKRVDEHARAKSEYETGLQAVLSSNKLRADYARLEGELDSLQQQKRQIEADEVESVPSEAVLELDAAAKQMSIDLSHARSALLYKEQIAETYAMYQRTVDELNELQPVFQEAERVNTDEALAKDALTVADKFVQTAQEEIKNAVCSQCKRAYASADLPSLNDNLVNAQLAKETATVLLEQAVASVKSFYAAYRTTRQELDAKRTALQTARTKLESLPVPEPMPSDAKEQLAQQEEELNTLWGRLSDTKQRAQAYLKWHNAFSNACNKLTHAETRIATIASEMAVANAPTSDTLAQMKQALEGLQVVIADLRTQRETIGLALSRTEDAVAAVSKEISAAETKFDRISLLKHQVGLRTELQKYLRNNRVRLMEDSWNALIQYASSLVSTASEGSITQLVRSNTGEFSVTESGYETPVDELSGAQKSIVGLSLRLSLAHSFYGDQGFVLLDEVTADCSETTAAQIAGMLRSLNSQVIMVTHRQSDALNANHSIVLE